MAVALPILGAFEAVAAAGSIAAAMSTVGGFLAVAGGVLTGVGILANDKGLKNFGAVMSLGSGLVNLASGAANASEAASSAWDDAASAAQSDAAQFGKYASDASAATAAPPLGTELGAVAEAAPTGLATPTAGSQVGGLSLQQRAAERAAATAGQSAGDIGRTLTTSPLDPVAKAAQGLDSNTMQSILGRARDKASLMGVGQPGGGSTLGRFIRDNKELLSLAGEAAGPEAEWMSLLRDKYDAGQSLLARRLRNVNSPIRLGSTPVTLAPSGG